MSSIFDSLLEENIIEIITHLRTINRLYLVNKWFAENFYAVIQSNVEYPKITDKHLQRCQHLTAFTQSFSKLITDNGFAQCLPRLKYIKITAPNLTNECLAKCPQLNRLDVVRSSSITDAGLSRHLSLKTLRLNNCAITGVKVAELTCVTSLELADQNNVIGEHIKGLPLRTLGLRGKCSITGNDIYHHTSLTCLNMYKNNSITDDSIWSLTNLTDLGLYYCMGPATNKLTKLTNLTALALGYNVQSANHAPFSGDDLRQLPGLKSLALMGNDVALGIGYCRGLTNIILIGIGFSVDCSAFQGLVLKSLTLIDTDFANESYLECASLTNLTLKKIRNVYIDISITNNSLLQCTGLTALDLGSGTYVTNLGLANCVMLKKLTLRDNDIITDDGITHLTNLSFLDITHNRKITNNAIFQLPALRTVVARLSLVDIPSGGRLTVYK